VTITPETRLRRARQANFRQIEPGAFAVLLREDSVYLDGVAGTLWRAFDGRRSFQEVIGQITSQYQVEPEVAEADIREFATVMLERGFLVVEE
jgi:hypothetical protein